MKMIPGHLYSYDCKDSGSGIFYGIYTNSDTSTHVIKNPAYRFNYVSSSILKWESPTFCCYICDSNKLTHIGHPSDFPEYFV